MPRIYLDNAATSFPKPEAVYQAMDKYSRGLGAAAGRGSYRSAMESADIVRRCRLNLARLFNVEDPNCFAFTLNGTDALNLALHGLLKPGDHIIATAAEHNSVLRPLRALIDRGIEVSIVDCDETGVVSVEEVLAALRGSTRLVAITHASNVTGAIQPVAGIVHAAKRAGALVLLDAAQTAGHLPIDLQSLPVDLLACSGHKGLLGPLGTGVVYIRPGLDADMTSRRQGGTGTASEVDRHPDEMPELLEAGNLNVPGIAGLEAATAWLLSEGVEKIRQHEHRMTSRLIDGLGKLPNIKIYGPADVDQRVGVVSVTAEGWTPQDLAAVLDAEFSIEVRTGLHCAPRIHQAMGTAEGGTMRLSLGAFTTEAEIDATVDALKELCGS